MDERNKQIDEIAEIIDHWRRTYRGINKEWHSVVIGSDIYEKGFRKIPEGAIILTKEEIAALNEYQKTRGDSIEK